MIYNTVIRRKAKAVLAASFIIYLLSLVFYDLRRFKSERYIYTKFINVFNRVFLLIRLIFGDPILSYSNICKGDEAFGILMRVGNHLPPIYKLAQTHSQPDYVNPTVIELLKVYTCAINNVNIL